MTNYESDLTHKIIININLNGFKGNNKYNYSFQARDEVTLIAVYHFFNKSIVSFEAFLLSSIPNIISFFLFASLK